MWYFILIWFGLWWLRVGLLYLLSLTIPQKILYGSPIIQIIVDLFLVRMKPGVCILKFDYQWANMKRNWRKGKEKVSLENCWDSGKMEQNRDIGWIWNWFIRNRWKDGRSDSSSRPRRRKKNIRYLSAAIYSTSDRTSKAVSFSGTRHKRNSRRDLSFGKTVWWDVMTLIGDGSDIHFFNADLFFIFIYGMRYWKSRKLYPFYVVLMGHVIFVPLNYFERPHQPQKTS